MVYNEIFNSYLDKLVRTEIQMLHGLRPAFQVCGCTGLALAILLAMTLVNYRGLSPWVMAGIVLGAVSILLGLTMITKIITGEERIINYHHQIAVLIVTAVSLKLVGQPVLAYLDATMLGVGLFIACGRIGCLMLGCCHGRPHRWGACYRDEHAEAGLVSYLVGVRLFPVQAVESLWVFGIVFVGSTLVLSGNAPGDALAWYLIMYSAGRFFFEFMRGDPDRPYYRGFSEPQWTALLLIGTVVGVEVVGSLTFHPWHAVALAGMILAMLAIALSRRFRRTTTHQLLHPRHVREVAEAIELVSGLASERTTLNCAMIDIGCTSLGIQISASKIKHTTGDIEHYALSTQNGMLTQEAASALARLIRQLKPHPGLHTLLQGNQGVFHLLCYPIAAAEK